MLERTRDPFTSFRKVVVPTHVLPRTNVAQDGGPSEVFERVFFYYTCNFNLVVMCTWTVCGTSSTRQRFSSVLLSVEHWLEGLEGVPLGSGRGLCPGPCLGRGS